MAKNGWKTRFRAFYGVKNARFFCFLVQKIYYLDENLNNIFWKQFIHGFVMKLLYYNSCQKNEEDWEYLDNGGDGNNAIETKSITPQNRTRALNNGAAQGWTNLETSGICIKVCGGIIKARVGDFLTNNKWIKFARCP